METMQSKPLVLLVDDDQMVLESVQEVIEMSGYRTETANDGVEALNILETQVPNIIVSDIMMPNMDGYLFHDAVRANPALFDIPFIFLSVRGGKRDIQRGFMSGADFYITKPFDPEELIIAIEAKLKRSAEIKTVLQQDVERLKQQIIDVFSHQLRTPLFIIQGFSEFLSNLQQPLDAKALDDIYSMMHENAKRLTHLVEDLMLIVNLDSGAAKASLFHLWQPLSLRSVFRLLISRFQTDLDANQISIEISCPDEVMIYGYPKYMDDLFKRLIDNAIKFGRRGGHIRIDVSSIDGVARVAVHDDGIGIANDKLSCLFDRFQQIDRQIMEQEGVGLGLTIASRLAEYHGGDIEVRSQFGEGSTFTVQLPSLEIAE